jgi:hypothetical protein
VQLQLFFEQFCNRLSIGKEEWMLERKFTPRRMDQSSRPSPCPLPVRMSSNVSSAMERVCGEVTVAVAMAFTERYPAFHRCFARAFPSDQTDTS